MAADDLVVLVEDLRSEEPVTGGEDDVVEILDPGDPFGVGFVEVESEETGGGGAVGVGFFGSDEMGCPEKG